MPIEKEIPKSYLRNSSHKTLVNILYTSNWILERLKEFLADEDITHQQYNILRILNNSETPLSTLKIREQMLDKMSDTSRIVERLLKKELVNKQVCATDKRLVDVTISEKGLILLHRLEKKTDELDAITSHLNTEDIDIVNQLLDKLREKE
jgi:DNA-binding MarR family transcriptional regulator